jgi:hypothetical protein
VADVPSGLSLTPPREIIFFTVITHFSAFNSNPACTGRASTPSPGVPFAGSHFVVDYVVASLELSLND